MKPSERWLRYLQVVERVWEHEGRVSFLSFVHALRWARAHMTSERRREVTIPSQPTFCRLWAAFKRQHRIKAYSAGFFRRTVAQEMTDGRIDPDLPWADLLIAVRKWAIERHIRLPAPRRLETLLRSARARAVGRRRHAAALRRERALGIVLGKLPLVRRFLATKEFDRYPPAWEGKANLQTMARETGYRADLERALAANRLSPGTFLTGPSADEAVALIEDRPPSLHSKADQRSIVEALPLYVARRWQQARDVVVACFVRKARSLRFRVKDLHDQTMRERSLTLLEDSGPNLRALRRAVLQAIEGGDPTVLRPHRRFLARLENQQEAIVGRQALFSILAGRGGYARKFTLRLKGIPFEGHDPHARILVSCLPELFARRPFRQRVPWEIVHRLRLLDVPAETLRRRRVFEPVLLMTLADLLATGRITIPGSRLHRNRWADVGPAQARPEVVENLLTALRRRLDGAWTQFVEVARPQRLVVDGVLRVPRVRAGEEMPEPDLGLPPCSIVDVLWDVHRATGFLDCFQLATPAPRHLGEDERRRLSLAVLLAYGMNIGLREAERSYGRWYRRGRLRNAAAHYLRPATLRAALGRILTVWAAQGLGKRWGTGRACSVDGRVVYAYEKNLVSRYHHRKNRIGVVIYWFVRDDWMAAAIRIIGTQEYEAWHILDELLHPAGPMPLESSCGDTHGQALALWGLSALVGKHIRARFRGLGGVRLYANRPSGRLLVRGVQRIRWDVLHRCAGSLERLGRAVAEGRLEAREVLGSWHLYDEDGRNVAEALRELGKVVCAEQPWRLTNGEATRNR